MAPSAKPVTAQVICSVCRAKRFFAHVIEGQPELTCAECGCRMYGIADGDITPLAPEHRG